MHEDSITRKGKKRAKIRDPRIPTSITRVGIYTVYVFDEEAYRATIAQYYTEDELKAAPRKPRASPARVFPKRKPAARYNWASTLGA